MEKELVLNVRVPGSNPGQGKPEISVIIKGRSFSVSLHRKSAFLGPTITTTLPQACILAQQTRVYFG
jgi:hypothetical protein